MSSHDVGRVWLIALGGVCAFALGAFASSELFNANQRNSVDLKGRASTAALNEVIRGLKQEVAAKDLVIADLRSQLAQPLGPLPTAAAVDATLPSERPALGQELSAAETRADFWAEETTRWVESSLALKSDERDLLKRRLREASLAGNADLHSVYEDALGGERAAELKRQELEEEAAERREDIEQEVFALSRKLVLTGEQEVAAREALLEVQEVLRPIEARMKREQERAMQLHRAPQSEGNTELFAIYREMQELRKNGVEQRREYLVTKLRESLNDEQLNALIEYETARVTQP